MPTVEVYPDRFEHGFGTMQVTPTTIITFQRRDRTDTVTVTLDTNCFEQGSVTLSNSQTSQDAKVRSDAQAGTYSYSAPKASPPVEPKPDSPGTMTGNLDVVNNY